MKVRKIRKIRKIQTIFSVVLLLTNPFLGLNAISYAETDDVLEAQEVEPTQTTESEAEVPTELKEEDTISSSEIPETSDTSVVGETRGSAETTIPEETPEDTDNEGLETTQETDQEATKDSTSIPSEETTGSKETEEVSLADALFQSRGGYLFKTQSTTKQIREGNPQLHSDGGYWQNSGNYLHEVGHLISRRVLESWVNDYITYLHSRLPYRRNVLLRIPLIRPGTGISFGGVSDGEYVDGWTAPDGKSIPFSTINAASYRRKVGTDYFFYVTMADFDDQNRAVLDLGPSLIANSSNSKRPDYASLYPIVTYTGNWNHFKDSQGKDYAIRMNKGYLEFQRDDTNLNVVNNKDIPFSLTMDYSYRYNTYYPNLGKSGDLNIDDSSYFTLRGGIPSETPPDLTLVTSSKELPLEAVNKLSKETLLSMLTIGGKADSKSEIDIESSAIGKTLKPGRNVIDVTVIEKLDGDTRKKEFKNQVINVQSPVWGTSEWTFDEATGTLRLPAGTLTEAKYSPWKRTDAYKISADAIKKIVIDGKVVAPTNSSSLFSDLPNVTAFEGLTNLDTSNVTNMSALFNGAKSLTSLDLSKFHTSNVTNMQTMFQNNAKLTKLDLSSFDTSKVTTMAWMFNQTSSLASLDLSTFNTSNVTNMQTMFQKNSQLTKLDLSHFDTSKVTIMDYMFFGTSNLSSLDLSNFDTNKVQTMKDMFSGAKIASLSLGDKFRFKPDAKLGAPVTSSTLATGKWIREDGKSNAYTSADFMTKFGTGDLTAGTYVADLDSLSATANAQSVPLGTSVGDLDLNGFVKEVKLGATSLTKEQYTAKLTSTLTTDTVGEQTVKVEVALKEDPSVKVTVDVPVEIKWGNSLVFKDDYNKNGFNFTAASISLLNGPKGPQLVATKGDGFRNAGAVQFYARPDITIYSKSLDTVVTQFSETNTTQHPKEVMNRWNGIFEELGDNLKYGDILGVKVNQSYSSNTNQNGKNTWVSRDNKLVTETEGFDTAYYEITKDGLKLLSLNALPNKQTIDYGTDSGKIDYTNYVKDVKIGEVVVPKEQYTVKLVGDFNTTKPGEQTIQVEVSLKEDPTHKVDVVVPVEVTGTLTIEVPDTLEFQDVKLAKKEQIGQRKTEKPAGFKVTDNRGSGKQGGWYVTAQAITTDKTSIEDYLIYKQINGVSENLTDLVKIHQQEVQNESEGPLTVDLTSWWTANSGILLKIPKENTLRPNMDYQATLVFNIVEAP